MMRCRVMVPYGKSSYGVSSCWEPLNEKGECPIHGQQVFVKPDWMSDEKWKDYLSNLQRQARTLVSVPVVGGRATERIGGVSSDTSDGGTQNGDTGTSSKS